MKIEQTAGSIKVTGYTDGWPLSFTVEAPNRVGIEDLHDLRYCIDRVLHQAEIEMNKDRRRI